MTASHAQALTQGTRVVFREPDCYPGSRGRVVKVITFPDHRFGFPSGVAVEVEIAGGVHIIVDAGKCEDL